MAGVTSATILKQHVGDGYFKDVTMGSIWEDGPVVVVVLRRPGCLMCRDESISLWRAHERFAALGVRLILVLHEWIQREVDAFAPEYWGGPIYYDPSKVLYAACHGGKIRTETMLKLLNPLSRAMRNGFAASRRKQVRDWNFKGEGSVLGGVLVYAHGGKLVYRHAEKTYGDVAAVDEVFAAAVSATETRAS